MLSCDSKKKGGINGHEGTTKGPPGAGAPACHRLTESARGKNRGIAATRSLTLPAPRGSVAEDRHGMLLGLARRPQAASFWYNAALRGRRCAAFAVAKKKKKSLHPLAWADVKNAIMCA